MPTNALWQPYQNGVQQVVCPLIDRKPIVSARRLRNRETIPELDYANCFATPAGRWPSRGWVLVRRGDYNGLNKYAQNLQLNFTDTATKTSVTLQGLSIVQAKCVSRGVAGDPNAAYLVELTDARGIMHSDWFQFPTASQYNIVAPAYPGLFYAGSINSGVPWNWSGMIGDLWGQMGAFLGGFPGLPSNPTATPEAFSFPGVGCWASLCRILDLIGMQVVADHTSATPYGIVSLSAADGKLQAAQIKYAGKLEDDFEYIDVGAGRIPGSVTVYFHRRSEYYGTEEAVRRDALQWWTTPLYSVTIGAPAQFAKAPGTEYLWDDFVVRFDVDGNVLPADAAQALSIATERSGQYYSRAYRGTVGYMRQTYAGCLPFVTGPQTDGVLYYQADGRQDFRTEVVRTGEAPWEWVKVDGL